MQEMLIHYQNYLISQEAHMLFLKASSLRRNHENFRTKIAEPQKVVNFKIHFRVYYFDIDKLTEITTEMPNKRLWKARLLC